MVLICLGRHGDVVNCTPIAYALSKKIGRVSWVVSKGFEGTLECCSYITPVIWNGGGQETLPAAIRQYQNAQPLVVQAFLNPDQRRLTDSFALEQWRYAGMFSEHGAWPLIFDRPNEARANMLRDRVLSRRHRGRPLVLVCVDGVTGQFRNGVKLLAMLRGLDADVIDLGRDVRAEKVPDLVPLFNAADCLVTIDTLPLHLARATLCPVVALINDGWIGTSCPPPQTVSATRYANVQLEQVVATTAAVISRPQLRSAVVVTNLFDKSERALKARATWPDWIGTVPRRSSKDIGDNRALPYMKDVLRAGLTESDADLIVYLNDDTALTPGALDKIKAHASRWDYGCCRRDPDHIGRECFWFSRTWLEDHIDEMPDVILSVAKPDLIMARWLRSLRGIKTTLENLALDFPPVELPAGLVSHAEHPSSWINDNGAATQHNERLWTAYSCPA